MDQTLLQLTLASCMLIVTAVTGLVPLKMLSVLTRRGEVSKAGQRWLSLLSCFSGGVFMSTCFLDIIPEISEKYQEFSSLAGIQIDYPIPYLFICIGFFLVYLMEEACFKIFSMKHDHIHDSSHSSSDVALQHFDSIRSDNLRKQVTEETVRYATSRPSDASFLKSLTFAIAISFHSLLEGFALGIQSATSSIVTLFVSLLIHKSIEAFSVGLQVAKGNSQRMKAVITTVFVYALMTPVGSILGLVLETSSLERVHKVGIVLIFESMAAGTFIYVTFLEVLAHEKENDVNSIKQLAAIFVGFLVIAIVQFAFSDLAYALFHGTSIRTTAVAIEAINRTT